MHRSLDDIIRAINKNTVVSFVLIITFFAVVIALVFISYSGYQKNSINQKLDSAISVFSNKMSEKFAAIMVQEEFRDYLNLGWISRERTRYRFFTRVFNNVNLDAVIGMEIHNRDRDEDIFDYGEKSDHFIVLDVCYLNRRTFNHDIGNCIGSWKLYFDINKVSEELNKINPDLIACDNCKKSLVIDHKFGDFLVVNYSNMEVGLTIKPSSLIYWWGLILFLGLFLSLIVIWNLNRIKIIFKKYLSDPILDITNKIKYDQPLPDVDIEELSYLMDQISQWKKQTIELEALKVQEKFKEERVRLMQSIGASIAHELRTPLRSMISGISGIKKYFPVLLKSYTEAREQKLIDDVIHPGRFKLLQEVLNNLQQEGDSANTIIDMFLMKIKESIKGTSGVKKLSIFECVDEALSRYVFQNSERELVKYDRICDFEFAGDKILVEHILFNLIKNSLYYIAKSGKGTISIHFELGQNMNELHFKDTGMGIAEDALPHIFERFYSKTEGGAGIGLAFCKMAMEWMDGDIVCESIEGEYTEFVLYFPVIKE